MPSLTLEGDEFVIRKLLPAMFGQEFPILFINLEKPKKLQDLIMQEDEPDNSQSLEIMKLIARHGCLSMNSRPFDVDEYVKTNTNLIQFTALVWEILKLSYSDLRIKRLDEKFLIELDVIAKRYGKLPSEVMLDSNATEMERHTINTLVASIGRNQDVNLVTQNAAQAVVNF